MVTSEANPLAKTGGLADVAYSLSKELALMHEDVSIIMPYYSCCNNKMKVAPEFICEFIVHLSWRQQLCKLFKTVIDGITYYLVGSDQYFGRPNLYGYHDDNERFAFFTKAIKDIIGRLSLDPDIVHIHDWQAGMLPAIIEECKMDPHYRNIKYVLTIHNPAFQGLFDPYFLGDYYDLDDSLFTSGKVRFKDCVSSLKTAIMYASKITTVSPTHREELLYTNIGQGLNSVLELRKDDFVGILNGIDLAEFNPLHDEKITQKIRKTSFKIDKEINKRALLNKLNLEPTNAPLYGMVSRLTWQKGLDILIPALQHILETGGRAVVLGSGEYQYEQALEDLRSRYPSRLAIYIGYNDVLAHEIYASSDIFLMPSLFEPCGISQMISLRYGTLPLVRVTGGLKDTVVPYMDNNLKDADGFGFFDYSTRALIDTIDWANTCYYQPTVLSMMRRKAMGRDNAWKTSANKYRSLYKSL